MIEVEKIVLETILYGVSFLVVLLLFITELILIIISQRQIKFPEDLNKGIQKETSLLLPPVFALIAFFFLLIEYYEVTSFFTWICLVFSLLKFLEKLFSLKNISEVNLHLVFLLIFSIVLPLNINPPLLFGAQSLQFIQRIMWLILGIAGYIVATIFFNQSENLFDVDSAVTFSSLKSFIKKYVTRVDIFLWIVLILFSIPHLFWGLVPGKDRLSGIWAFSNDEWTTTSLAYTMIRNGTLFVNHYYYPSLYRYMVWLIATPFYPIFAILGFDNFLPFSLFLARIISLFFSGMLLSLIRIASEKFGGRVASFIAPISCLFMPVFLEMSSTGKPDMTMVFFIVISIYFCMKALTEDNQLFLRIGWLGIAVATTTKYNAFLAVLIPLAISIQYILKEMKGKSWNLTNLVKNKQISRQGKYILESFVIGLLGTPDALRNFDAFGRTVVRELRHLSTGFLGAPEGSLEHSFLMAKEVFGYDFFIIALIGLLVILILSLFFSFVSGKKKFLNQKHIIFTILSMLFIIPYWITISSSKIAFSAYLLPLAPLVAIGFGAFYGIVNRSQIKNRSFSFILSAIIVIQILSVIMMSSQSLVLQIEWLNDSRYQLPSVLSEQTNISEYSKPTILLSPYAWISPEIASYSDVHLVNETEIEKFLNGSFQPDFLIISSYMIHRYVGSDIITPLTTFYQSLYEGSLEQYDLVEEIHSANIESQKTIVTSYLKPLVLSFDLRTILNSFEEIIAILSLRQMQGPSIQIYQRDYS